MNIHDWAVFSVLDLQQGYYQIPMDPKDIKKMTIITLFGLFEYLPMPFGMKIALKHFKDSWTSSSKI